MSFQSILWILVGFMSTSLITLTDKEDTKPLLEGTNGMMYKKRMLSYDENPLTNPEDCNLNIRFEQAVRGMTVEFVNKSQGNFTDIEWTFGDGIIANDLAGVKHTYKSSGLYYYSITLYNKHTGCVEFFTGNFFIFDTTAYFQHK